MKKTLFSILTAIGLLALYNCSNSNGATNGTDSAGATSAQRLSPDTATLIFFGDAMQHQAQFDRAKKLGTAQNPYNYDGYYDLLKPAIADADYAVVNLELPLAGGKGGYSGFPCFSAPDSYAIELQKAGFDMLLTSNNHSLDRKDFGVRRTLDVLDSMKIDHIGTYRNAAERSKLVPFVKEINGIKVGFLNYTYGTNGLKATDGAEVALIDKEKMKKEIAATRNAGAEIIVVLPHWGVEYKLTENSNQRDLANFLINEGVDVIIGGHPHVIQPMKVVTDSVSGRRSLVVYSLGNFVSNMTKANTYGGAFVRVVIARDPKTGKVHFKNADYDTFVTRFPTNDQENWQVVPRWHADKLPASQKKHWEQHNTASTQVFDRDNVDVPRSTRNYK